MNFLAQIREIARFGQVKLERLNNRVTHLDNILPYDGDLTQQQRLKRTIEKSINEDELIDYTMFLDNNINDPIELNDIVIQPEKLVDEHEWDLKQKLDKLKEEAILFFKHARHNNHHRFRRQTNDNKIIKTRTGP